MDKRILKAYERYDYNGKVVAGSLVLRYKKPKNGKWKELTGYECCNDTTTTTTTASPTIPLSITIDAPSQQLLCSFMSISAASSVVINWGDGSPIETVNINNTGSTNVSHSYPVFGTYPIEINPIDPTDIGEFNVAPTNNAYITATSGLNFSQYINAYLINAQFVQTTSIILPSTVSTLNLLGNSLFTDVLTQSNFSSIYSNLYFTEFPSCALNQSSVDYILSAFDSTGNLNRFVNILGNAAPSAAGLVSKANLISKGWTVLTT
jgi:hypothetical protein